MSEVKRILIEFAAVGVICLAFGFVANSLNSYGLSLSRNYFPPKVIPNGGPTTSESGPDLVGAGFQVMQHQEVVELVKDPLYAEGYYVLMDARKKELYTEGHIPGAWWFDHLRIDQFPEGYLEEIIEACMAAGKVVCYCEGGDCTDSQDAAMTLTEHGIDVASIHVYTAGYHQWIESGMLIETGERNSGEIKGGSDE